MADDEQMGQGGEHSGFHHAIVNFRGSTFERIAAGYSLIDAV
jgi:hypothetical protein